MENSRITTTPQEQRESMLATFRTMELVAHAPEDFDPSEQLTETDQDYALLMGYFDQSKSDFDYKKFMSDSLTKIGLGFHNVLIGYEVLFEKYCEPNLGILKEKELSDLNDNFSIKGRLIEEHHDYNSFQKAVNLWSSKYGLNVKVIAVDNTGTIATLYEIRNSKKGNHFPIKVYLADRIGDTSKPHSSLSNN